MDSFNLSNKTRVVMENFTKFLSIVKSDQKKIRLTPNWLEFKISGIVGFYDASKDSSEEENSGFQEIVISDSKKFLDLIGKIGLENAQYKEPFLYLKKGDAKVKYHTSPLSAAKPVDRKIIEKFDKIIKNNELIMNPFELDLNEMNNFFENATMLGHDYIKFESKNNSLKIIAYSSNGVDAGYYEENINIKINEKINVPINKDFITKMYKGSYKIYFSQKLIKFESLDLPGLMYFLSYSE